MQHTYQCNGDGLPDYPAKVDIKDVNVYLHDSGMMATHDYSCPVCRRNHAVLDLSVGVMQPCISCQGVDWVVVQQRKPEKKWYQKLFNFNQRR